jgi:hypothetical protein
MIEQVVYLVKKYSPKYEIKSVETYPSNPCDWAVPWVRRLVAGLSPRRPGFDPDSVHVGFVVDKIALGQVLLQVRLLSPVNLIPPVLH